MLDSDTHAGGLSTPAVWAPNDCLPYNGG